MSEALFSTVEMEASNPHLSGYRLQRLEVFNWGTFDAQVWTVYPGGQTSLLTGDIGSGKSTVVDAITTLLLPANRISYNKAAGAGSRERSLRSYVEGHYRSERDEASGTTRAVGLRDRQSYSVILGVFTNPGYSETVTIAQVFQQRDTTGQPYRFYVTAPADLTITTDFADFGSDLNDLRRRLRTAGASIDNDFPEYGRRTRRLLGIRSPQALDLFHQTVSMKSVGNLNDFVRTHMLEPADAAKRVEGIVAHFDDLTKAHKAVQTATAQLELLDPLVASADKFDDASGRHQRYRHQREALVVFGAELALQVLAAQQGAARTEVDRLQAIQADLETLRQDLAAAHDRLLVERSSAGGDRLAILETEIGRTRAELHARQGRQHRYGAHLEQAQLEQVTSAAQFRERTQQVVELTESHTAERLVRHRDQAPLQERKGTHRSTLGALETEITSLAGRRNNLPSRLVDVRELLCAVLGADEADLPFAGELIDVAREHHPWQGAAERVLRPFAMTLLVPQALYARASAWVNSNYLGTRLVFLRVPERRIRTTPDASGVGLRLHEILEVEPGEFADYLTSELARRADHHLVNTVEDLRGHDRAVTREGLIRDRDRHEKDDRTRVEDATRWVLGRSSERKLAALREDAAQEERTLADIETELTTIDAVISGFDQRLVALRALAEYTEFANVNAAATAAELDALTTEHAALLAGSTRLIQIDRQLQETAEAERANDTEITVTTKQIGATDGELDRLKRREGTERATLASVPAPARESAAAFFDDLRARMGEVPADIEAVDQAKGFVATDVDKGIDDTQREMNGYTTSIIQQMSRVLTQWPALRSEMDATLASIGEFRSLHTQVKADDLPRFEAEFRQLLNTESVHELAQFNNWLNREAEQIQLRVERINEALGAIDYNPGRKITLIAEATISQEIRAFRADLRAATGDLLGAPEDSHERFEAVRSIIERFKGRPNFTDADKAWTSRVTDVRNWFSFAAEETDRITGAAFEHYTDSDGKSGGQKEKLAYTILAASLAYQFGLEWGVEKSKDFRFVVIDEAFGRGSDDSTRYALELFARLGLQLLIVTPLQKVHVIEPYVRSIGYVDNDRGDASRVHNLTVEEYRERRAQQE